MSMANAFTYILSSLAPEMPYPLEGYKVELLQQGDNFALGLKSPWPTKLNFYRVFAAEEIPDEPALMADFAISELDELIACGRRKMLRTPRCYFQTGTD